MLNLKVSKQTRSETSKNKDIYNHIYNLCIYFRVLQKSHVILLKKNIKLKEKYYINKKTHLATEKKFGT